MTAEAGLVASERIDGRLGRALRELWPDANPLRRTCDRVEAWILAALCAMFLVGAPVAAVIAGGYVYGAGINAEFAARPVLAILLANAQPTGIGGQNATAPATWTAPGGDVRYGRIHVPEAARAGSAHAVWVDRSGQPTGAPLRGADLVRAVAVATALTLVALGAVLVSTASLARWALQHRRLVAWETDWRITEPRWVPQS